MSTKLKFLLALSSSTLILAACQGQDAGNADGGADDTAQTEDVVDQGADDATNESTDGEAGGSGSVGSEDADFAIAMVTDEGGVDDRSFNQSAWEGMQAWSEETGGRAEYFQSTNSADYIPNFQQAATQDFDIIYGIGFQLEDAVSDMAASNPEQHFGIVDSVVEADNVVSLNFADHEAAFLAGAAAALTTEKDQIGFIGGIESPIIDRFETGFLAGVEEINPDIDVDVQYADSFSDAAAGQQIANGMYTAGADVIYHAAGAVGNGLFNETRNRLESNPDEQLWAIGVDRDQEDEGEWDGGNFVLTSTLKQVGTAIQLATEHAKNEGFPGGENIQYGLKNDGVDLVQGNLSDEAWAKIQELRQQIIDGELEVPEFSREW